MAATVAKRREVAYMQGKSRTRRHFPASLHEHVSGRLGAEWAREAGTMTVAEELEAVLSTGQRPPLATHELRIEDVTDLDRVRRRDLLGDLIHETTSPRNCTRSEERSAKGRFTGSARADLRESKTQP